MKRGGKGMKRGDEERGRRGSKERGTIYHKFLHLSYD